MKERGIIDPFALVLLVILALESLAVIHYCSPPVLIPSLKEGCMKVELTPITQEGATKETP